MNKIKFVLLICILDGLTIMTISAKEPSYSVLKQPKSINIVMQGLPGTRIYENFNAESPTYVIPDSGILHLSIDNKQKLDIWFAEDTIRNIKTPFAFNFTRRNFNEDGKKGTALGFAIGGAGFAAEGLLLSIVGGAVDVSELLVVGLTSLGLGAAATIPGWIFSSKLSEKSTYQSEYNFVYLPNVVTNQDLKVLPCQFEYEPRTTFYSDSQEPSKEAKETDESAQTSGLKLKDNAILVAGNYVGNGLILQDGDTIDHFINAKVVIKKKTNRIVTVSVVDNSGKDLIGNAVDLNVKKKGKSYEINNSESSPVTITINERGNLIYRHPSVKIEGDTYQVVITGKKMK